MDKELILKAVWEQLAPFLADVANLYPDITEIHAVQFRGFNPKSASCPRKRGTISLWVNKPSGTVFDETLRRRNAKLLNTVWAQLIQELGDSMDRVMIAPVGGVLHVPGIYPEDTREDHSLPIYQPYK